MKRVSHARILSSAFFLFVLLVLAVPSIGHAWCVATCNGGNCVGAFSCGCCWNGEASCDAPAGCFGSASNVSTKNTEALRAQIFAPRELETSSVLNPSQLTESKTDSR